VSIFHIDLHHIDRRELHIKSTTHETKRAGMGSDMMDMHMHGLLITQSIRP
jgi:hypothetical protein